MIDTPIFDQLVSDPEYSISQWPRDDLGTDEQRAALEEPWPDPWVVLPPSPDEAQRLVAERAGWDTQELDARAYHIRALADAERTIQFMALEVEPAPRGEEELVETEETLEPPAPEPESEQEPELVEVPPGVDEFLDDPDTGVTRKRKEKDDVDE